MQISQTDIENAKNVYVNHEEVSEDVATLYAKALTRYSKQFPGLPKGKYVTVKQASGNYLVDARSSETCTADGRE